MIAPGNVQFFKKDWKPVGDKKTLARTLSTITRVPVNILTDGLSGNRPCVAQIMSWAANRTTMRVEDRAYSLMGLLGVNMPMLYGEGAKAFHRLQLEVIRCSNDQSIFAWGWNKGNVRTGSILADDPSFFGDCSEMELMNHDEFIESLKRYTPAEALSSIDKDRLGVFPITNRGIHIWMLLCPHPYFSNSFFHACLPCRNSSSGLPVAIGLVLWGSDYYRRPWLGLGKSRIEAFRRRASAAPPSVPRLSRRTSRHDVRNRRQCDDFTCSDVYPSEFTGNKLILSATNSVCVRFYSNNRENLCFAVAFGQCFDQSWVHAISSPANKILLPYVQGLVKGP